MHVGYIEKRMLTYNWGKYDNGAEFAHAGGKHNAHTAFMNMFKASIVTNLTHEFFTRGYVKSFPCADCGGVATERCHTSAYPRPVILRMALEDVWPDTSSNVKIVLVFKRYIELHKECGLLFKCRSCHAKEPNINDSFGSAILLQ